MGILPFVVGSAWLLANGAPARGGRRGAGVRVRRPRSRRWCCRRRRGLGPDDRALRDRPLPLLPRAGARCSRCLCALLDPRRPRWSLVVPVVLRRGRLHHPSAGGRFSGRGGSRSAPTARSRRSTSRSPTSAAARPARARSSSSATIAARRALRPRRRGSPPRPARRRLRRAALSSASRSTPSTRSPSSSRRNGHSDRPLTRSESGVLDWVDRTVGTGARVTEIPYPSARASSSPSSSGATSSSGTSRSATASTTRPRTSTTTPSIWFPNDPAHLRSEDRLREPLAGRRTSSRASPRPAFGSPATCRCSGQT